MRTIQLKIPEIPGGKLRDTFKHLGKTCEVVLFSGNSRSKEQHANNGLT